MNSKTITYVFLGFIAILGWNSFLIQRDKKMFDAYDKARTIKGQPTVILAKTVKGWGTPLAGHKDNHAGLMTPTQMEAFRAAMGIRPGHEWDHTEGHGVLGFG